MPVIEWELCLKMDISSPFIMTCNIIFYSKVSHQTKEINCLLNFPSYFSTRTKQSTATKIQILILISTSNSRTRSLCNSLPTRQEEPWNFVWTRSQIFWNLQLSKASFFKKRKRKRKTLQGVSQSEMPRPVHSRPGASSCHVAAAWAGNAAASAESSLVDS